MISDFAGPKSDKGKIYKYNRGVILYYKDKRKEYNLDIHDMNHGEATSKGINYFTNKKIGEEYLLKPFASGVIAANNNILCLQIEGDNSFLYVPNNINNKQIINLKKDLQQMPELLIYTYYNNNFKDIPIKSSELIKDHKHKSL